MKRIKQITSLVLAFLMVYTSVAWNGLKVVQAEGNEAALNGIEHATLQSALAAAVSGDKVTLLQDVTVDGGLLLDGVDLDLAGNTLTADYLVALKGSSVIDNTSKDGLLVVPDGKLMLQENNEQVPVYDATGYRFVFITTMGDAKGANKTTLEALTGEYIYLTLEPVFGNISALLVNGAADNKVSIGIRLSWTDTVNGTTQTQDCKYTDSFITTAYADGQKGMVLSFTADNLDGFEGITATPIIISEAGVECVGTTSYEKGTGSGEGTGVTVTTLTIEGESFDTSSVSYANEYTKAEYPGQSAVQYQNATNATATWNVNVATEGTYTFTAIGTGAPVGSVKGDLYVDNVLISKAYLNTNGAYNVFADGNQLVSELGAVALTAGDHTIKLVVNGGVYVMDKLIATTPTIALEAEDYTETNRTGNDTDGGLYTKAEYPDQAAVQYKYVTDNSAWTTYTISVESTGTYAVTTIGQGSPLAGYLRGTLYVDDTAVISDVDLNNSNGYNVFPNPYVTKLGTVTLEAGEYTIKFAPNGGVYVMDKIFFTLTPNTAE